MENINLKNNEKIINNDIIPQYQELEKKYIKDVNQLKKSQSFCEKNYQKELHKVQQIYKQQVQHLLANATPFEKIQINIQFLIQNQNQLNQQLIQLQQQKQQNPQTLENIQNKINQIKSRLTILIN